MSKIEVLRVPDERRSEESGRFPEGTLIGLYGGIRMFHVKPEYQPALLAALLDDAGAVKIEICGPGEAMSAAISIRNPLDAPANLVGPAWLLPAREEGGE